MANNLIQVNYEELERAAKLFELQLDACRSLEHSVQEQVESQVGSNWTGEAAQAFRQEVETEVLPALQRLRAAFEKGMQVIRQVSHTFLQAEEETVGGDQASAIPAPANTDVNQTLPADGSGKAGADGYLNQAQTGKLGSETIRQAQKFNDKKGYSVDLVRRLERFFGLPHSTDGENGRFSEELVARIAQYQEVKGLKAVDGKVGEETLASLREDFPAMLKDPLTGPGSVGRQVIPKGAIVDERYNFYKSIIEGNYGTFRSGPGEVNIVSIRGMVDGRQVANKVGESNDTFAVVWQDENGIKQVEEFHGSVDPGIVKDRMNEKGVAHLKDGSYIYQLEQHYPGGKNHLDNVKAEINRLPESLRAVEFSEKGYTALRQKSAVTVYRDHDIKGETGHGHIEAGEMVEDRGQFGINIHYSGKKNPWSQGCQVIAGGKEFNDFIRAIKNGKNTDNIPYTVIDASKVNAMGN